MNKEIIENISLEPRVAKLETGLDTLTKEVSLLSSVVRDQGKNIENGMRQLSIDVTSAMGPKKTDWSVIFAGLFLIMAIGSAVFFPLNRSITEIKDQIRYIQDTMVNHVKLDMHPVGNALITKLENEMRLHSLFDDKMFSDLDKRIQRDMDSFSKFFCEKLESNKREQDAFNARMLDNKK